MGADSDLCVATREHQLSAKALGCGVGRTGCVTPGAPGIAQQGAAPAHLVSQADGIVRAQLRECQ